MESPIRVLLVDDEADFCDVMSKRLKKRGFDTTVAHSAEDAMKTLRQEAVDVVVLDFRMEGMDGMTALGQIKLMAPGIQVIMLTGHGTRYAATRALVREAFDYLAKPCDAEVLASRIRDARAEKNHGFCFDRRKAADIMTLIEDLETISADRTVAEAIERMTASPMTPSAQGGERPFFLVLDARREPAGILTVPGLLNALKPEYIRVSDRAGERSHRFSSVFWNGYFMRQAGALSGRKVGEVMSSLPEAVNETANLLEVANLVVSQPQNMVLVRSMTRTIGIITPLALAFELREAVKRETGRTGSGTVMFPQNPSKGPSYE